MNIIAQLIFRLRNPSFKAKLRELQDVYSLNSAGIESFQSEKFKDLIQHFAKNHKSFETQLRKNKIDPSNIQLSDLRRLPITSKEDLVERFSELNLAHLFSRVYKAKTSGSTGVGFTFYKNEEWDSFVRASREYFLNQNGQTSFSKSVYFWGFSFGLRKRILTRFVDFVLNRKRFFSYKVIDSERFLRTLRKSNVLIGYSSMVNSAAEFVIERDFKIEMDAVISTSERILPSHYVNVQKAFGTKLLNEYGAAETGIIAFSCPYDLMHINEAGVIVELDENGEILVTNLYAKSIPIIRYKLGDYVTMETLDEPCKCGRTGRYISDIMGRVGSTIIGKMGKYPSLTLYYVFKSFYESRDIYLTYTATQDTIGKLIVYLKSELNTSDHALLLKLFGAYFANDVEVDLVIDPMKFKISKKRQDFISKMS